MQKWYNELIGKTSDEITITDVVKMLRQKKFVEMAASKAVEFLQKDIFVGDMFEGELLEALFMCDMLVLQPYSSSLKDILTNGLAMSNAHDWLDSEEKADFEALLMSGLKKLEMANSNSKFLTD